ncbi:hypothetical protein ACQPU1_13365 [Clostridium paraputrificum]|uniref:hypothetical protein n=1 Tax=Clostridium paraputrificum TaxID=29363 RepID=UPI003D3413EC
MYSLNDKNKYSFSNSNSSIKAININIPMSNRKFNLISYNCTSSITNWELKDTVVTIEISLFFKILYTYSDSSVLNVLKYNTFYYDKLLLDDKVHSFHLTYLNYRQALTPLSRIESIDLLFYSDTLISLLIIINNELKINYGLSILYLINSKDEKSYLYSSDINCENFNQIGFSLDTYNNLSFSSYDYSFFYLRNNSIYNCSLVSNKITLIFHDVLIKWFFNIDYNKFIILKNEEYFSSFILINLNTKSETLLYKSSGEIKYLFKVNYSKLFAFTLYKNNKNNLVVLDIYGSILFNDTVNFIRFYINNKGSLLIGISSNTLTIVNIINPSATIIHMPIDEFDVNNIVFYSENIAILLGRNSQGSYIYSFNLVSYDFTLILKSNFSISSMDIDYDGNILFSSNELGLYNIYSMSLEESPKIVLRLFSDNLSLLIRR